MIKLRKDGVDSAENDSGVVSFVYLVKQTIYIYIYIDYLQLAVTLCGRTIFSNSNGFTVMIC